MLPSTWKFFCDQIPIFSSAAVSALLYLLEGLTFYAFDPAALMHAISILGNHLEPIKRRLYEKYDLFLTSVGNLFLKNCLVINLSSNDQLPATSWWLVTLKISENNTI